MPKSSRGSFARTRGSTPINWATWTRFSFRALRWWITRRDGATSGDVTGADVTAALLLYTAFETPVLQGLTDNDDQGDLWRTLLPTLPDRAHVHYRARHEPILRERYRLRPLGTHQKMRWTRPAASARVGRSSDIPVRVLTDADRHQIQELYRAAYPARILTNGHSASSASPVRSPIRGSSRSPPATSIPSNIRLRSSAPSPRIPTIANAAIALP